VFGGVLVAVAGIGRRCPVGGVLVAVFGGVVVAGIGRRCRYRIRSGPTGIPEV